MVRVVYFNQWFSSIAWVIEDLKRRNDKEIKIIASSKNPNHAYKDYVDEFIVEDWEETDDKEESMKNYTDWVLNLCVTYKVDYFFVKKHATAIMDRHLDFFMRGIFIISEDSDTLEKLSSKANVYRMLSNSGFDSYIPDYINTENREELVKYINNHKGKNDICIKFDSDEGGASFRAIRDKEITAESLYHYRVNEINTQEALQIAFGISNTKKIIAMEMLDNPEISVDCYRSKQGFIAICREKLEGRIETIYSNKEISDICCKIGEELNLRFPYNVQFRYRTEKSGDKNKRTLKLLEINPRMSGGLYYEVANGLNIADICLKDCMNKERLYNISDFLDFEPKFVTHLELPINIK